MILNSWVVVGRKCGLGVGIVETTMKMFSLLPRWIFGPGSGNMWHGPMYNGRVGISGSTIFVFSDGVKPDMSYLVQVLQGHIH